MNLVLPGRNYGWPVIGYGKDYGGARLHASVYHDNMEQPIQFWTPVIAPSGLMVYTGGRFPKVAWQHFRWRPDRTATGAPGPHGR